MDISNLSPNETAKLALKHPLTGEEMEGCYLVVYGSDSKVYRQMLLDVARERVDKKDDADAPIRGIARLVKEIHGLEENGKPIADPFYLLTNYPWVREQADVFVMKRANFLPNA